MTELSSPDAKANNHLLEKDVNLPGDSLNLYTPTDRKEPNSQPLYEDDDSDVENCSFNAPFKEKGSSPLIETKRICGRQLADDFSGCISDALPSFAQTEKKAGLQRVNTGSNQSVRTRRVRVPRPLSPEKSISKSSLSTSTLYTVCSPKRKNVYDDAFSQTFTAKRFKSPRIKSPRTRPLPQIAGASGQCVISPDPLSKYYRPDDKDKDKEKSSVARSLVFTDESCTYNEDSSHNNTSTVSIISARERERERGIGIGCDSISSGDSDETGSAAVWEKPHMKQHLTPISIHRTVSSTVGGGGSEEVKEKEKEMCKKEESKNRSEFTCGSARAVSPTTASPTSVAGGDLANLLSPLLVSEGDDEGSEERQSTHNRDSADAFSPDARSCASSGATTSNSHIPSDEHLVISSPSPATDRSAVVDNNASPNAGSKVVPCGEDSSYLRPHRPADPPGQGSGKYRRRARVLSSDVHIESGVTAGLRESSTVPCTEIERDKSVNSDAGISTSTTDVPSAVSTSDSLCQSQETDQSSSNGTTKSVITSISQPLEFKKRNRRARRRKGHKKRHVSPFLPVLESVPEDAPIDLCFPAWCKTINHTISVTELVVEGENRELEKIESEIETNTAVGSNVASSGETSSEDEADNTLLLTTSLSQKRVQSQEGVVSEVETSLITNTTLSPASSVPSTVTSPSTVTGTGTGVTATGKGRSATPGAVLVPLKRRPSLVPLPTSLDERRSDGYSRWMIEQCARSWVSEIGAESTSGAFEAIVRRDISSLKKAVETERETVCIGDCETVFGNSLLLVAAQHGWRKGVKYLTKRGADINLQNHRGNTSLHFATEFNHTDVMQFLLKRGASVSVVNSMGMTCNKRPENGSFQSLL